MNILIPALALGIYTILFFFYLGLSRRKAVQTGAMDPRYYRTFAGGQEPDKLRIVSRHAANLLEVPMWFYVVVLMILVSGESSTLLVGMAWAYMGLRFVHAFIHLRTNNVLHRFLVFGISTLVLLAMWVTLLVQLVIS